MTGIEVDKIYKTRDGHKVRIYSVDRKIHGAIYYPEYDEWEIYEWSVDGGICLPEESPEDIISEWTEPEELGSMFDDEKPKAFDGLKPELQKKVLNYRQAEIEEASGKKYSNNDDSFRHTDGEVVSEEITNFTIV